MKILTQHCDDIQMSCHLDADFDNKARLIVFGIAMQSAFRRAPFSRTWVYEIVI